MNLFIHLIFGHIAGDYLFQSEKMAKYKGSYNKYGYKWCFLHTIIYIASIFAFVTMIPLVINYFVPNKMEVIYLSVWFYVINFIGHYVMDYWSLGQKWLNVIRGRNFLNDFSSTDEYRDIALAFSCMVYVIVDNGIHLMMMYYTGKLLGG